MFSPPKIETGDLVVSKSFFSAAQRVSSLLHKEFLLCCTKSFFSAAQRVYSLLHKEFLLCCTKSFFSAAALTASAREKWSARTVLEGVKAYRFLQSSSDFVFGVLLYCNKTPETTSLACATSQSSIHSCYVCRA